MRFTLPCLCNTGISVRKGKGRYRDTHIVTFAPRYLLDNRSTHKLAFAQREFARGKVQNLLITYFNTKYSEHVQSQRTCFLIFMHLLWDLHKGKVQRKKRTAIASLMLSGQSHYC